MPKTICVYFVQETFDLRDKDIDGVCFLTRKRVNHKCKCDKKETKLCT